MKLTFIALTVLVRWLIGHMVCRVTECWHSDGGDLTESRRKWFCTCLEVLVALPPYPGCAGSGR